MRGNILLLVPIILPIITGLIINKIDRKHVHKIISIVTILNLVLLFGISNLNESSLEILRISSFLTIKLNIDNVSKVFTVLASIIWILSTFYSFEYMKHENNEERYFKYFLMTLGIIIGIGFSGNMFTFYLFYEFMTLITFPLVIHSMNEDSMKAGIKYLLYSFSGAALVLIGIFFTYYFSSNPDFLPGGNLDLSRISGNEGIMLIVYILTFIGFGGKAGMFPLHAWLPTAHPVAPAPASGILSGIITKAGVLGILRMTYYVYGANFIKGTWAQTTILLLTMFTIFMGSMLAFRTKHLKERLAYSSVSQVSYVLFGLALLNMDGFIGSLLHMVFHALIKNILFLSVGAIIYKTGKNYAQEIKGIGKSMPIVMWCFTLASLALVGIPPLAGYISKYYLGIGGLSHIDYNLGFAGTATLILSALLTAGYLIPIFVDAFFPGQDFDYTTVRKIEPSKYMTIPLIVMTIAIVAFGMFPGVLVKFFNNIAVGLF
ncbi:proton-conducting transporter membrane subunit [Tissierella sp. Yu-01]|uniref:complex I subunit 5 family protein n=1 Tax=Tissierella sp. Yu-01 TaxID=3035694 RepID=UPI00240D4A67|nr:proton-conducting transporter membrane subunit [Tissierella sp. Yu-01]WFA08476.1 proton-conducting transporter membrane subunit [Tissierella sp. Yu-01]